MTDFRAFRIHRQDNSVRAAFQTMSTNELTEGDVLVRVRYSSINYKDALAATGQGRILRTFPLNGGIDLAGEVVTSADGRFGPGDEVLVCGGGLSETRDGGYAEYARVPADVVVPLPGGLSLRDAMAIGTAGFTAALAVMRLEENGQLPAMGPILVTGASGGVGSLAIDMLAGKGFEVTAFTGKVDQHDYLRELGATAIVDRRSLELGTRPLEKALWGGAVDSVGGEVLAWLTRTVRPWGSIASIGLAGGHRLELTVMPFILRAVSILGVNSVELPASRRERAWQRLAADLKPRHLDRIGGRTITFDDLPAAFDEYIAGTVVGRTVVAIGGE